MSIAIKGGDIFLCDFSRLAIGSMQGGTRPCVIVDNHMACAFSPCIHCVPLTSQDKKDLPLHYKLDKTECDALDKDSIALCEQYTLIDKSQLMDKIGEVARIDLINISSLCIKNLPFVYD